MLDTAKEKSARRMMRKWLAAHSKARQPRRGTPPLTTTLDRSSNRTSRLRRQRESASLDQVKLRRMTAPALYHEEIVSPVRGFFSFGSKLRVPSADSWKTLPVPCPRSSWFATWTYVARHQRASPHRGTRSSHLKRAIGPGFVFGDFGRRDEGHCFVRSLGGKDVGERDVLVGGSASERASCGRARGYKP